MGKIGEFEKTVVAEPLKEPLPAERQAPAVPEPVKKKEVVPVEVKPSKK
ncbi:MAG: hypothetical protein AB1442_08890 [Nitrospirota bacterium]